jgi:chorismate mutase/prephenate dehydratase
MAERLRVSFLGPEATFTHEAAIRHFGDEAEFIPSATIAAIFDDTEAGRSDMGVVPVENALEGTVNITLDRLIDSPLIVTGGVSLPIDIHLLTNAGELGNIQRVLSHPHAVAQCRRWLQENLPGVALEEVASTSLAAKMAGKNPELAALGSALAAKKYGLEIAVVKIDTESINVTRFFVLGKEPAPRAGRSGTSLLFVLKNKPGALYNALAPIAKCDLNMTKIESRPSRRKAWDYIFFMDLEGHAEDENLAGAIAELKENVMFFRLLGSYPVVG